MMEQQSRVSQLQKDISLMLNQQHHAPESAGDRLQHLGNESVGEQHAFLHQSPHSLGAPQQYSRHQVTPPSFNQMVAAAAATSSAQTQHLFNPQAWTSVASTGKAMAPRIIPPPFNQSSKQGKTIASFHNTSMLSRFFCIFLDCITTRF